ncbi:hypothetical protein ACFVVQ_02850 [Paenibacillus chitinolyticus]|uniref:Uncharacterized protein n=1 Tax=Paenibacillus chitinolyticus TaxID=79263 RepID=A0A410WW01_9BACL|nr:MULTISPECIES: hypothetical protein [Paenibacillus]MCY9592776.1 hypothetical protein [Paenibacillus chitinolyticus]MCY9597622.1 hypothetical protein [Paenibacillus chitinolyticus]QAV18609.1 hypothetical protein PC41400_13355 [Paenibacillus chitinolyticus]
MNNNFTADAERVLIVYLNNDIVVENVPGEVDVDSYLDEQDYDARQVELISMGEFNERLDQMLLQY